jgi:hypothetical protein
VDHVDTVNQDRSRVGPLEPGQDAQRRRLSAPAGTEQRDEFSSAQTQGNVADRVYAPEALGQRDQLNVTG